MAFAVLVVASAAVGVSVILDLARLALESPEYSHLVLIVPLSATMIWRQRTLLFASSNPRLKSAVLCFGVWTLAVVLVLFAKTHFAGQGLTISVLLLITFWVAAFCSCFGTQPTRKALFPLTFLVLLVPLPRAFAEVAISFSQQASADAVNFLYQMAGVPVLRDGQSFILSNLELEIAKSCSGIRSTVALFIMALLLGHFFLKWYWTKAALVIAVLPLAIIKNAVRIFTISMLANYVDLSFMDSPLHHSGGILFFAFALFFLALLLLLLLRLERNFSRTPMAKTADRVA